MKMLKDAMKTLGLTQASLGEVEKKNVDLGDDVAKGFVAPAKFDASEFVMEREALDLDVKAAEEMGFRLHHYYEWPELIRIWPPAGMSMDLKVGDSDEGVYELSNGEISVDFSERQKPVALVNEDQEGLVLHMEDSHLQVGQLLKIPESPSFDDLGSPLEQWLEDSSDEWIVEEGRRRLATGDSWEELVGLGHLARHEEIDASEREALVEQLLQGGVIEGKERILRWADEELDDEAARQIAARTATALDGLFDELEELRRDFESGEEIESELVTPVLERRDDVQSVWYLLRGRDAIEEMLRSLIDDVDELGRELVDDYRLENVTATSTQLRRASLSEATAWWTELVWGDQKH